MSQVIELARELAGFFRAYGYPYPAVPELRIERERYPLVVIWDDAAEVTRVIACCDTETNMTDALAYAETIAAVLEVSGEAITGAIGHVVCSINTPAFDFP